MDDQIRYVPTSRLSFPLPCENSAEVAVLLSLHFVLAERSPIPPTPEDINRAEMNPRTFQRGLNGLLRRGLVVAVKLV